MNRILITSAMVCVSLPGCMVESSPAEEDDLFIGAASETWVAVATFEAENAALASPFTKQSANGVTFIAQATNTGVTAGGKASFVVQIPETGSYRIRGLVDAASIGANSFYVNFDAEPTDPTMIWDVAVTAGFQERFASWRGSGAADAVYPPKVFALTQGAHTLVIRGREPNTRLDTVIVERQVVNSVSAVAYWKLDGNTADSSGNGRTGTLLNGANYATGIAGQALRLNGVNQGMQVSGLLTRPASITVAGWANLSAADSGGAELVSLGDVVTLRLDGAATQKTVGFYWTGTTWHQTTASTNYAGTGWHHFAYTIDSSAHVQRLYVDGIERGSTSHADAISYAGRGTNTFVGRQGNNSTSYDFNGTIDEVRVYEVALSAASVQALYAQAQQPSTPTPPPPSTPTPPPPSTPTTAQRYVTVTGSTSSSCTAASPCTLSRADAIVLPGEIVSVADGTYGAYSFARSGSSSTSRVRWVAASKWGAKMPTARINGHYVDLEGFDITKGEMEITGNYSRAIGNYVHDNPVSGCDSNGGAGINATGWQNGGYNGHHQEIIGNVVARIGTGALQSCGRIQGIYSSVPDVLIANNVVYGVNAYGIHLWHAATRNTIVNNTVVDNGWCMVIGNGDGGGTTAGNLDTYVANNICYGNIGNFVQLQHASSTIQSNNLFSDPLFVNRTGRDFHLTSSSPAIDAGTTVRAPTTDLDGKARTGNPDIGAYER